MGHIEAHSSSLTCQIRLPASPACTSLHQPTPPPLCHDSDTGQVCSELEAIQGFPKRGLRAALRRGKVELAGQNFAWKNSGVDSPFKRAIPVAGGLVLMKLAISFQEDCRIVEEPLKATISIPPWAARIVLDPSGPWRARQRPILSSRSRDRRRRGHASLTMTESLVCHNVSVAPTCSA